MPRRALTPAERLRQMHEWLAAAYGPQHWWPAETSFEVILGAYLTQNTSWKAVERSLANLRAASALSLAGIRKLSLPRLQELIRPSGFYSRKAPAIKAFVAMLDREFAGSLKRLASAPTETLRDRLLALPGVGYETADAILLYALQHPVPVADAYLRRIAERHGLIEYPLPHHASYNALVQLTRAAFAADPASSVPFLFNEFHALTVAVGKAHCSATPRCEGCPLARDPHTSLTDRITRSPASNMAEGGIMEKTRPTHISPGGLQAPNQDQDEDVVNDSLGTIDTADSTGSDSEKETGDAKTKNHNSHED